MAELMYPIAVVNEDSFFKDMCSEVKNWVNNGCIPSVEHYGAHMLLQCNCKHATFIGEQNWKEGSELIHYIIANSRCYVKQATTKMSVKKQMQEHFLALLLRKYSFCKSQTLLKSVGYLCNNPLMSEVSVFSPYSPLYLVIPEVLHIEKHHVIKLLRAVGEKYHLSVVETEKLVYDVLLSDKLSQVSNVVKKIMERKLSIK